MTHFLTDTGRVGTIDLAGRVHQFISRKDCRDPVVKPS